MSWDLFQLENTLWVITEPIGMPAYDFRFSDYFECRRPWQRAERVEAVARLGAAEDYGERHEKLLGEGVKLIHTPEQYDRASLLPLWYPLIEDMTPRSVWFNRFPSLEEVRNRFRWPVFLKGERQTSRHQRRLSIIEGPEQFAEVKSAYENDPILRWQRVVCREYVPLRPVGEQASNLMPKAFEFRTFWWRGECVSCGNYWTAEHYELTEEERAGALGIAGEAARRVDVPFLVVDVAQALDGRWLVIECNDGQDAGYAGNKPLFLWRRVIDVDRERLMGSGA